MSALLAALIAAAAAPACEGARCHREWTVLLFVQGEAELAPHAFRDLRTIEGSEALSSPRLDVVAQLDAPGVTGLRRYRLSRGSAPPDRPDEDWAAPAMQRLESPPLATLEERDGEPEWARLRGFLEWGVERYPSRHLMVVVWGHAQGWAAAGRKDFGGLAINGRTGGFIDGPGLKAALDAAARRRGRPIDVYVADACLMQTLELAAEIGGAARFVAGSPQIQSFQGLPYRALLRDLAAGIAPEALARKLPAMLLEAYDPEKGELGRREVGAREWLAFSSVDSEALRRRLVPALQALAGALEPFLAGGPHRALDVRIALRNAPSFKGDTHDLGALLRIVRQLVERERADGAPALEAPLRALAAAREALDATVVGWALGHQYEEPAFKGTIQPHEGRALGIWAPSSADEYRGRAGEYEASSFFRAAPLWPRWLARLHADAPPR